MDSLTRNMTTAEQAIKLENSRAHPLQSGAQHSAGYFEILEARRRLPVIIVSSETGAGKSTQIPQFVFFDEYESGLAVACTQPRRLAATSLARRVAQEMDVTLGDEVGYSVRFDKASGPQTRLKYMSDGTLLQEAQADRNFGAYSCIILDEAHQRTTSTDILMGLLKRAVMNRPDLKVVIMSATLDADKFKNYFGVGSTFEVAGRSFPVEIKYLARATHNYLSCALLVAQHIHRDLPKGDILLFVCTAKEVEGVCSKLRAEMRDLEVMPLHSKLLPHEQDRAFEVAPMGRRKCVVTTNIAEASLTIDGIVYVIDPGLAKNSGYSPRSGLDTLLTTVISKASAQQRAGRAGRTEPGVCFRLYTADDFRNLFRSSSLPAILENEIATELLTLISIGHTRPAAFDFMDFPHPEVYFRAIQDLVDMQYIHSSNTGFELTETGREASKLPFHPSWWNCIRAGHELGCSDEIISIVALAETQNSIFIRPEAVRYVADQAGQVFAHPLSDHLARLNALHRYVDLRDRGSVDMGQWCRKHFLSRRELDEACRIRWQIKDMIRQKLLQYFPLRQKNCMDADYDSVIRQALARGLFYKVAYWKEGDIYTTVHDNRPAGLNPNSSLVGMNHKWVVSDTFTYRGKQYMENVTAVEVDWLVDMDYFQDSRLVLKRDGALRQPKIKAVLDEARARRSQNSLDPTSE